MELVYLWVEDYKNIKKQGFNFSPNFECEFIPVYEDEKVSEKSELKITQKENSLKDFFGENINITAIVGENGSGKSSVLELLKEILNYNKLISFVLIFKEDNQIYYKKNDLKIEGINIISQLSLEEASFGNTELLEIFKPNKEETRKVFNEEYFTLCLKETRFDFDFLKKYFFDKCTIQFNISKKFNLLSYHFSNKLSPPSLPLETFEIRKEIYKKNRFIEYCFDFLVDKILDTFNQDKTNLIEVIKSKEKEYNDFNKKVIEVQKCIKIKKDQIDKKNPDFFKDKQYQDLFKLLFEFDSEKLGNTYHELIKTYEIDDLLKLKEYIENNEFLLYLKLNNVLEYSFYNSFNNIYLNDLSDGEINFLMLYTNIAKYFNLTHENEKLILLDESEIFFHPNWQKKLVLNLISFLKKVFIKNKIQILVTSHSPFILSDLPKQNVIFLEKDEKTGNCINATNKVDINPFGANIHTLLSHGFFMKDGLMGEFAKSKIDDVIKYLNNDKDATINNDKDAQNIINIIGEPIIKRELQRMLKNKMELSNKEEIDTIKEEIKELTEKLEKLEGKK